MVKQYTLKDMFGVEHIIQSGGLWLIALIIFAESGMFIGFLFPGDTLLLSAGVYAASGHFSLISLIPVIALAAILGDNTGYYLGKRFGHRLFAKEDGVLFRKQYVDEAHKFYQKYGSKAMLFAHFFPIVRTFAPPVAGLAGMNRKQFIIYDAIGDTAWATVVTLIGFWFGKRIHNLDRYILLCVVAAMLLTLIPALYQYFKKKRQHQAATKSTPKSTTKNKT